MPARGQTTDAVECLKQWQQQQPSFALSVGRDLYRHEAFGPWMMLGRSYQLVSQPKAPQKQGAES